MLETEAASARYRGLDAWSGREILEALWEGQAAAVAAVRAALPALERAAEVAAARLRSAEGRLVYAGAGCAGQLALLDALELAPTFGWPPARLAVLLAGGLPTGLAANGGPEDDAGVGRRELEALAVGAADVVIGVAASGTTPYTLAVLEAARARGALTVALASNPGTPLLEAAEHPVLLDTGAEVVAGSTRLKAGTAQRAALGLLSTLLMTRLGRVFDGHMVDMHIDNAKLRSRGLRVLEAIAGCDRAAAEAALARTGDRVKPAVLVLRGLAPDVAERLLAEAGGSLRTALARLGARAE